MCFQVEYSIDRSDDLPESIVLILYKFQGFFPFVKHSKQDRLGVSDIIIKLIGRGQTLFRTSDLFFGFPVSFQGNQLYCILKQKPGLGIVLNGIFQEFRSSLTPSRVGITLGA